jgi:glycosyltransferase involved in cell wall biosynthesis
VLRFFLFPSTPSVSIIMPVFNQERYCREAIDSIRAQTHRAFELIVVDDGSNDGTPEILKRLALRDRRIRVFSRPRSGVAASLNFAISMARCELLARADGDDVCEPDRIAQQVAYMADNPGVGVLGGQMLAMRGDGKPLKRLVYKTDSSILYNDLMRGNPIAHPTTMMRRSLVMGLGGYRKIVDYAEDYDLWLRIGDHAVLANLPDILVHYRVHGETTTSRHARRQAFHAAVALLAAKRRRAGMDDPLDRLAVIDEKALDIFDLDPAERARMTAMLEDARREDRQRLAEGRD